MTEAAKPPVRTRSRTATRTAAAPVAETPVAETPAPVPTTTGRRLRSRLGTPPAVAAPGTAAGDGSTDWMKSGAEAQKVAEAEKRRLAERQAAGARGELYAPRRLEVESGRQVEIVVLDAALDCFLWEHQQYVAGNQVGRRTVFETCPRETQPCPLCDGLAGGRESYYVMMLTVLELDPGYTKEGVWTPLTRDVGGEKVALPYIKRLMAVKVHQQEAYFSIMNELGSMRGLQLVLDRSATDRYAPQSGVVNVALSKDEGQWVVLSEEEIIEEFGHEAEYSTDAEPVLIKEENADTKPYNYGRIFQRPDAAKLRTKYAGANAAAHAPTGSRQANEAAGGSAPW